MSQAVPRGPTPRWRVRLKGEAMDLEDLAGMFTSPDLRVVREGNDFFLESATFGPLGDSAAVHEAARAILPILNGVAKVKQHRFRDVEVDVYVIEFPEGGGRKHAIVTGGSVTPRGRLQHVVLSASTIRVRARVHAPTIIVGDQQPSRPEPGSLDTDRWAELAASDAKVFEALRIFGSRPHDWVNLYRVLEIVEGRTDIVGSGWASRNEIERFSRTANHPRAAGPNARHAESKVQPSPNPMTTEQGSELIRRILAGWLGSLESP